MTSPIQYESAVAEFEEGLLNALRGHAASAEYLEIWVPDEDPVRSILNMAESAETLGAAEIAVAVRRSTLPAERDGELVRVLSDLGGVSIEAEDAGIVVRIVGLGGAAALDPVHESLRAGIQKRLAAISHEGPLTERDGLIRIGVSEATVELVALIDPATHAIKAVRHQGSRTPVERAILDALCAEVEGTPVADASDHGLIRVLGRLRDPSLTPPVPGILHPVNADPAFGPILRLVHQLRAAHRERVGGSRADNEFDLPPSAGWRELDDSGRRVEVERGIASFLGQAGLSSDAVQLLRIDGDLHGDPVRVVVTFAADVPPSRKPDLMRVLERALKARIEGKIQLYHEQRKDENTIRRL